MIKALLAAGAGLALATAAPAQTTGAVEVGVAPVSGLSASDYVKMTADADNFEIQSGRVAAEKSRRDDVRGFAKQMIADHAESSKALAAALTNQDRKIATPPTTLSSGNQAKLALLRKAPKGSFDQLYLQQQLEAHQAALGVQEGYADTGADPTLKQVAATMVPVVERHLSEIRGMTGAM